MTNSSLIIVRDGTYILTGAGSGISAGSTDAGSFASHISTASEQIYTGELSQISLGTSAPLHYWSAFGLMARGDLSNTAAMISKTMAKRKTSLSLRFASPTAMSGIMNRNESNMIGR